MWSGMRASEMWRLPLQDVHPSGAHPHAIIRFSRKGLAPKNGEVRRVPLFGRGLEALRKWLAVLPKYARKNPHKLVFPTLTGCRREDSKAPRHWKKWLTAAKLDRPELRHDGRTVRWHDLRHTCGSSLASGVWGREWRLEEVRDVLGHSAVAVTERYAHLAPGTLAEAAKATTGLALTQVSESPSCDAHGAESADLTGHNIGHTLESANPLSIENDWARPGRFELPTPGFVGRCSIQLSYGRRVCLCDRRKAERRFTWTRATCQRKKSSPLAIPQNQPKHRDVRSLRTSARAASRSGSRKIQRNKTRARGLLGESAARSVNARSSVSKRSQSSETRSEDRKRRREEKGRGSEAAGEGSKYPSDKPSRGAQRSEASSEA